MFSTATSVPKCYRAVIIHGFVEELVVNEDPEYQWIDRIRTPRASNEARQRLISLMSGSHKTNHCLKNKFVECVDGHPSFARCLNVTCYYLSLLLCRAWEVEGMWHPWQSKWGREVWEVAWCIHFTPISLCAALPSPLSIPILLGMAQACRQVGGETWRRHCGHIVLAVSRSHLTCPGNIWSTEQCNEIVLWEGEKPMPKPWPLECACGVHRRNEWIKQTLQCLYFLFC